MKLHLAFPAVACLAWMGVAAAEPAPISGQAGIPVLVHDMKALGATAMWTRRDGYCTLQIVMPHPAPDPGSELHAGPGGAAAPAAAQLPVTQAWLLRADGTSMPSTNRATEPPRNPREHTVTITYYFPQNASHEATAVAMMINGRYFVEALEPFPDER